MVQRDIPVFCYWNGCIKEGPDGPYYEGSNLKVIRVKRKTKFAKLLDELHCATGLDKQRFKLDLVGRYPSVVQQTMVKYIRLPVIDDTSVETMLEIPTRHPSISNVELYLEAKPVTDEGNNPVAHSLPSAHNSRGTEKIRNSSARRSTCQSSRRQEGPGLDLSVIQQPIEPDADSVFGGVRENNGFFEDEGNYDIGGDTDDMGDEDESLHVLQDLVANLSREHVSNEKTSGLGLHTNTGTADNLNVNEITPSSQAVAWKLDRKLREGRTFLDRDELQKIVRLYSIKRHREYEVVGATTNSWIVKCKRGKESGCKWKLRAVKRKKHGLFEITKYISPHTCAPTELDRGLHQLGGRFLADEIESIIKSEPSVSIGDLTERVKEKFGHTVAYSKMWQARRTAIKKIFGDFDKTFKTLPRYMAALQKSNRTIVEWQFKNLPYSNAASFLRMFWAFPQSIEGFSHCRPLMSIDAVDFNGKYKGKMMIAMGIDANNHPFPLAFAITEEESFDSWRWFLSCIRQKVTERRGLCLISNPHQDIIAAVNQPGSQWQETWAYHRFCLRHICSKFDDQFNNKQLKDYVYKAGSAHHPSKFDSYMRDIEKSKPEARRWLDSVPVAQWSLAHDGGKRYGIMTTNLAEVFDTLLKGARDLPFTKCAQLTFDQLKTLFDVRRGIANESLNRGQMYTPHVMTKLQGYMTKAGTYNVMPFDHIRGVFEVSTPISHGENTRFGGKKHVVQINQGTCTCGKWQIYKFPCSHVLAVCERLGLNSWQYVEEYYTVEKYSQTWAAQFSSVPSRSHWTDFPGIPRLFPHPSFLAFK